MKSRIQHTIRRAKAIVVAQPALCFCVVFIVITAIFLWNPFGHPEGVTIKEMFKMANK